MQFDEKSVSTIAAAIGYQVGRSVAAANKESKELEATEMSLVCVPNQPGLTLSNNFADFCQI